MKIFKFILKKIKSLIRSLIYTFGVTTYPKSIGNKILNNKKDRDIFLMRSIQQLNQNISYQYWEKFKSDLEKLQPLNPVLNGAKYFSQYDEDGIIDDILSRLSYKSSPRFLEIGVGGGLEIENNTINLLINGSSGIWIEASKRNVNEIKNSFHFFLKRNQLTLINKMITPYNIKEVLKGQISSIELFSLDIDSIDYYILKELLLINKFKPSVLVIEYNAIFGPSANVVVDYEACLKNNQKNSYFGASLLSYSKLLFNYNYILVCTGVTGSNAYFVRKDLINSSFDKKYLDNVKERVKYLYNPARYFLAWGIRSGMFPAVGPFRE